MIGAAPAFGTLLHVVAGFHDLDELVDPARHREAVRLLGIGLADGIGRRHERTGLGAAAVSSRPCDHRNGLHRGAQALADLGLEPRRRVLLQDLGKTRESFEGERRLQAAALRRLDEFGCIGIIRAQRSVVGHEHAELGSQSLLQKSHFRRKQRENDLILVLRKEEIAFPRLGRQAFDVIFECLEIVRPCVPALFFQYLDNVVCFHPARLEPICVVFVAVGKRERGPIRRSRADRDRVLRRPVERGRGHDAWHRPRPRRLPCAGPGQEQGDVVGDTFDQSRPLAVGKEPELRGADPLVLPAHEVVIDRLLVGGEVMYLAVDDPGVDRDDEASIAATGFQLPERVELLATILGRDPLRRQQHDHDICQADCSLNGVVPIVPAS